MATNTWSWDPERRSYYFFSPDEMAFVYQDGQRINVGPQRTNETATEPQQNPNVEDRLQGLTLGHSGHLSIPSTITGTSASVEQLDIRFRVHRPGEKFFKIGKVFKVLWAEPAGQPSPTSSNNAHSLDEQIIKTIRCFVVIMPGQNCCTCLPVETYDGSGVAKPGILKSQHAVIHTSNKPPKVPIEERPDYGEEPMRSSIRVVRLNKEDRLDDRSRINYGKMYTVEHNVKVYNLGDVHKDYLQELRESWKSVLDEEYENSNPNEDNDSDSDDDD